MAVEIQHSPFIEVAEAIPAEEWALYTRVLHELDRDGIPRAIGGGLAFSAYARRWRNTKDMDLYILPADQDRATSALKRVGLEDYYPQAPYDRRVSFRGVQGEIIVDLLWEMLNGRAQVDADWLSRGPRISVRGAELRFLPVEELIWSKLYVVQRDRCDWPDLLNILAASGETLDWHHLLERIGPDAPLLGGLLSILCWLAPAATGSFPRWIWPRVGLAPLPGSAAPADPGRLSGKDWFGPKPPSGREG